MQNGGPQTAPLGQRLSCIAVGVGGVSGEKAEANDKEHERRTSQAARNKSACAILDTSAAI